MNGWFVRKTDLTNVGERRRLSGRELNGRRIALQRQQCHRTQPDTAVCFMQAKAVVPNVAN